MTETLCASPLVRGTEFILDDQGVRLFGTCGQRALASAASSALGHEVDTLGIYDSMRKHGWADPGGASQISGLRNQAQLMNIPIAGFVDYNESWSGWLSWLQGQIDAGNPCVLMVHAGQKLTDSISGWGENAQNLVNHFIFIAGRNTGGASKLTSKILLPGWWSGDGDSFAGGNDNANNFNAANVLQYYTDTVLGNAWPCAGLALKGRATKVAWTQQADGTGLDDQKHVCGKGFMAELASQNETSVDGVLSETYYTAKDSFLALANGHVYHWDGTTVAANQGAQVLVNVWKQLEALTAVTGLPVTPPGAPTLTPSQELDIAAMAAIKAALAAV